MYSKLSQDEKIIVVDEYINKKLSCKNIAKLHGVSHQCITRIIKRAGITIRGHSSGFTYKYRLNENYFDKIDTPQKAYWLGFCCADGCNDSVTNSFKFCINKKDIIILEKFKESLDSDSPITFKKATEKYPNLANVCSLEIRSPTLIKKLSELGCTELKTFTLKFPTEEQVPKHLQKYFILGYFDGDGCFYTGKLKKTGQTTCLVNMVSTEDFCIKVKEILWNEINVHCSIIENKKKKYNIRLLVITAHRQCCAFGDWMYDNKTFFLDRKYNKYLQAKMDAVGKQQRIHKH